MVSNMRKIDDQVKTLIDNINKLQNEIQTYHKGAAAFELSSIALADLTKAQKELSTTLSTELKKLEEIDTVKIIKQIDQVVGKLGETRNEIKAATNEVIVYEGEMKDTLREVAKYKDEVRETAQELTSYKNDFQEIKEQISALDKQNKDAIRQLNKVATEIKAARIEMASKDEILELKEQNKSLTKQNKDILKQLAGLSELLENTANKKRRWFS